MPFPHALPILILCAAAAAETPAPQPGPRVALVCQLEGQATLTESAGRKGALGQFQWLPARATLAVAQGSRLVLVFAGGERWAMKGPSQARVEAAGLSEAHGEVQQLATVPMIPSMANEKVQADGRPGAFTVRGRAASAFTALVPGEGDTVLADEATLAFLSPLQNVRFRVDIEDESGHAIFSAETLKPSVGVSVGILKPGSLYFWRVRTLDGPRPSVSAETSFTTVPEDQARIRARLKARLDQDPDPALRALLVEMDHWLGLKS